MKKINKFFQESSWEARVGRNRRNLLKAVMAYSSDFALRNYYFLNWKVFLQYQHFREDAFSHRALLEGVTVEIVPTKHAKKRRRLFSVLRVFSGPRKMI